MTTTPKGASPVLVEEGGLAPFTILEACVLCATNAWRQSPPVERNNKVQCLRPSPRRGTRFASLRCSPEGRTIQSVRRGAVMYPALWNRNGDIGL